MVFQPFQQPKLLLYIIAILIIYCSQIAKNVFKKCPPWLENAFKLSTMVRENFDIYTSQMAKNAFNPNPGGGAF